MRWPTELPDDATVEHLLRPQAAAPPAWVTGPVGIIARWGGALRARGVEGFVIELHGPTEAAHAVVRAAVLGTEVRSFGDALAAADHARLSGLDLEVVTQVSRSGARVLRELAALVRRLGAVRWRLRMPWTPPELSLPQLPRAALTMPFVLDAARRASEEGMAIELIGAPLCLLGPHASLAAPMTGAEGAPCDLCSAKSRCAGLGPSYRALFGDTELRPLSDAPIPERP